MSTRTLLPLTVMFALTGATALGVAISPVIPGASAPVPAVGACQAPPPAPVTPRVRPELEGCRETPVAPPPGTLPSRLFR
jgi:hypothetical protein